MGFAGGAGNPVAVAAVAGLRSRRVFGVRLLPPDSGLEPGIAGAGACFPGDPAVVARRASVFTGCFTGFVSLWRVIGALPFAIRQI